MQTHYLEAIVVGILTAVIATATGVGDRKSEVLAAPATASAPLTGMGPLPESVRHDGLRRTPWYLPADLPAERPLE